jgi:hypothetical protein
MPISVATASNLRGTHCIADSRSDHRISDHSSHRIADSSADHRVRQLWRRR